MLKLAGLEPGARVVVMPVRPVAFFVDLFALWQLGAVVVCASPSLAPEERMRLSDWLQPGLWLDGEAFSKVPRLDLQALNREAAAKTLPRPEGFGLDDPALIMLTSGTGGVPKGVVHTQRSLQARLALNLAHIGSADLEVGLDMLPLSFGHGLIGNCLTVLAGGGRLMLYPEPGIEGLSRLGEIIDTFGITFFSSVPAMWRAALKMSKPPKRGTLRRVHVGSAPLSADLWSAICDWCGTKRVFNMYGMTETANWIAGHSAEDGSLVDGMVGRLWGGSVRLRTESGEIVERGKGEILIASPSLMAGYYGVGHPDPVIAGGWFATGDIGEIGPGGDLRLVGRLRDDVNRGGIKIHCAEIDLLLERHPQVREACAFPLEDAVYGEIVGVAVVLEGGAAIAPSVLRDWCAGQIRSEAVPDRFFILDSLPTTARGKRLRPQVRELCLRGSVKGGAS